ncbi:MAG: HlyD family efflux transporter periplasmic adaptor subunit [Candidatus Pacebacteria bacterium]|nr:HlyD family efflux transporter periplasmic adaptor subunit [Candidatus Paceibacterota bacterium]
MNTQEIKIIKHRAFILFSVIAGSLLVIAIGVRVLKATNKPASSVNIPSVVVAPLHSFKQEKVLLINNGTVESLTQAELRSQVSAPVASIKVRIGQTVDANQILVTLKNNDLIAQFKQAQAALAMQKAMLNQVISGARSEDLALSQTDLAQAQEGLSTQYTNALTLIGDAYVKTSDAVVKQIAGLILNDDTLFPQLAFTTNNAQAAIDAAALRVQVQKDLVAWRNEFDSLNTSDYARIDSSLTQIRKRLSTVLSFFNRLDDALSDAGSVSGGVVTARANVNIARGIISGLTTAVTGQIQGIASARLAVERVEQSITLKQAGGTDSQREAQEAAVAQAEAGVAALSAQVEKTIIRSPISGKVASLPVRVGELISPGQLVSSVVNTRSLQVKTFISEVDLPIISEGDNALIAQTVAGKVLRVAPSVDSQTKKVEVDILVVDEKQTTLVIGQTVDVSISAQRLVSAPDSYLLPLSAVRVSPSGSYIFRVVDDKVQELQVQTGALSGEFIQVMSSVASSTEIITIARGVKVGDTVSVSRSQ